MSEETQKKKKVTAYIDGLHVEAALLDKWRLGGRWYAEIEAGDGRGLTCIVTTPASKEIYDVDFWSALGAEEQDRLKTIFDQVRYPKRVSLMRHYEQSYAVVEYEGEYYVDVVEIDEEGKPITGGFQTVRLVAGSTNAIYDFTSFDRVSEDEQDKLIRELRRQHYLYNDFPIIMLGYQGELKYFSRRDTEYDEGSWRWVALDLLDEKFYEVGLVIARIDPEDEDLEYDLLRFDMLGVRDQTAVLHGLELPLNTKIDNM